MGTVDPARKEFLKQYLAIIPRDKISEATYQEIVRSAEERFLTVKYDHILTTPLLEVFAINIRGDSSILNDGKPCEVYGRVRIIIGENSFFDLYNHGLDDPETVHFGDAISLVIPKGCAIFPSAGVKMEIDLKDKARSNLQIAKGSLIWEFQNQTDFEKVDTKTVHGEYGSAVVRYVTIRHAVIATLDIMLDETSDGEQSGSYDIYGSITAHYGTTYSSILFEKNSNQAITIKNGASIELSRCVVPMPAYSSLLIKATLYTSDGQQIVCKDLNLEFCHHGYSYTKDLAENGSIKVEVMWENAYMLPPSQSMPKEDRFEEALSEGKADAMTDQLKLPFFSVIRNSLSERRRATSVRPWPLPLKEVFSVYIGTFKDAVSTIYGSIATECEFTMFERENDSPVCLLSNQTLPAVVSPSEACVGKGFAVTVKLKDVNDNVLSRGGMKWTGRLIEFKGWSVTNEKCSLSWYDRHLSSVIRGEKGYAAIHYMIISRGLKATIKVRWFAKSSSAVGAYVWGSLIGRYSNQRYPTHYEKEYFRSKLFLKNQEEAATVSSGEQIPLSQSVVAVPINSSLIVEVNLYLRLPSGDGGDDSDNFSRTEVLGGFCLEFRTDTDYTDSPLRIVGQYCDICMSLEWTGE